MSIKVKGPNSSIDIEKAIETVRQFTLTNESGNALSLEQFDLQDGALHHQARSGLEKTIAFTMDCLAYTFSASKRKMQHEKHRALTHTLQSSLNLLKIYSSAITEMSHNRGLAEKLRQTAYSYNAMVRETKNKASSLTTKIKRFFFEIAGWAVPDELLQSEIHIPETVEYSQAATFSSHKITIKKESSLSTIVQAMHKAQKPAPLTPKIEELDAFRLKAITLLQSQKELTALSDKEIVDLVQNEEIVCSFSETVIHLRQLLHNFPGEEIELRGSFQRDPFHPSLCFPVKESFKIYTRILQSGFPHPMQYIGFSLHEKLFPTLILQPKALTLVSALLEKKRYLSHALLPEGPLYSRAKKLFSLRLALLPNYKDKLQEVMQTIIRASKTPASTPCDPLGSFEELCKVHEEVAMQVIARPLELVQQQWLFGSSAHIKEAANCKKILQEAIAEACRAFEKSPYALQLATSLGSAIPTLYLMQLSEHFGFAAPELSSFDKMVLTSLFRQELIFISELEESFDVETLPKHLESLYAEEKALFSNQPLSDEYTLHAQKLVNELISYFKG